MKFKSRGSVKGNPEVAAKVRIDPLRFDTNIAGSFECNIGAIKGYVGDIRIRFASPFMKARRRLPADSTGGRLGTRSRGGCGASAMCAWNHSSASFP